MRPTIELSRIVKNGARGLPACLASVRGIADRIVIGDTGSTDDGMAIARGFGAEIFNVPWTEDYAAARNGALARTRQPRSKAAWSIAYSPETWYAPSGTSNRVRASRITSR